MDIETKTVQDLANALPHEEPRDYSYPNPEPPKDQGFVDTILPEERLSQTQLLDYLRVPTQERHDPIIDDYIRTVYDWARDNAQSGDFNQLLRVISEQEMHMGSKLKPDRLRRLAEYVKINRLRQSLSAREQALYG